MATQAQIRAAVKYNKGRDSITIRPDREEGQRIRDAAAAAGIPLQQYILIALREKMGALE